MRRDGMGGAVTPRLIEAALGIARRAGDAILEVYATDFEVDAKADASPVTAGDRAAEAVIVEALGGETGTSFPIVSEEAFDEDTPPVVGAGPFWLVDPLDGTKEFIKRNGEFTVNIALIVDASPVFGVVHAPAVGATYWGSAEGAYRRTGDDPPAPIASRQAPGAGLVALVSRSHRSPEVDAYLANLAIGAETSAGSSLKFCLVATGEADIYPRLGRTMEWDTAAGQAVACFAGATVTTLDGAPLAYGKPGFENPHFVVRGRGV